MDLLIPTKGGVEKYNFAGPAPNLQVEDLCTKIYKWLDLQIGQICTCKYEICKFAWAPDTLLQQPEILFPSEFFHLQEPLI
jgi:hypothetical protein